MDEEKEVPIPIVTDRIGGAQKLTVKEVGKAYTSIGDQVRALRNMITNGDGKLAEYNKDGGKIPQAMSDFCHELTNGLYPLISITFVATKPNPPDISKYQESLLEFQETMSEQEKGFGAFRDTLKQPPELNGITPEYAALLLEKLGTLEKDTNTLCKNIAATFGTQQSQQTPPPQDQKTR